MRKNIAGIVLGVYFFLFIFFQSVLLGSRASFLLGLISIIVAGAATLILLRFVSGRISRLTLKADNKPESLPFTLVFFITMLVYMTALFAYFPGAFNADLISQLNMATGDTPLTDWHPALRIILFMMIPMKLFNNYTLVMVLQLLYFALAFAYLEYVMYINGCPKWFMGISCGYTWLNPFVISYAMFCEKDFALLIVSLVLVAFYIQIVCSKGEWLNRNTNVILLGVFTMLCWFFRHNAPFFVVPFIVIVMILWIRDNRVRIKFISILVAMFVAVQLVYSCLGVERHDKVKLESVGLPLNVWCSVMQNNPDSISEDTRTFLYSITDDYIYQEKYEEGNFNSIKYNDAVNTDVINSLSYADVVKYSLECIVKDSDDSLRVVSKVTCNCWGILGNRYTNYISVFNCPYLASPMNETLTSVVNSYLKFSSNGLPGVIFGSYGLANMALVVVGGLLLYKGRKGLIHVIPLITYNYGTMLLLTTRNDYRYFLLTLVLWLPLIFLMFRDDSKINKEDN